MEGNYFTKLSAITCHTEKKGKLTYISWAEAWAQIKHAHPSASYEILQTPEGLFLHGEGLVMTEVTVADVTHRMWLPVMDGRNNQIERPTTTDINKALMRCLTKNLAMHGLGTYVYQGEDLPVAPSETQQQQRAPSENERKAAMANEVKDFVKQAVQRIQQTGDVESELEKLVELADGYPPEAQAWATNYLDAAISQLAPKG